MAPINERHAAMDETAAWAQANRFAPIITLPPAHPAPRFIPQSVMSRSVTPQVSDADSATVLEALVEAGELDDERADLMLRVAAETRIRKEEAKAEPTKNGKFVGIAADAVGALTEIVTRLRNYEDYGAFSEVDVDQWAAICRRAGVKGL
jgi:hypothetical protein